MSLEGAFILQSPALLHANFFLSSNYKEILRLKLSPFSQSVNILGVKSGLADNTLSYYTHVTI